VIDDSSCASQLLDGRALPGNNGVLPEDYQTVEIPCSATVRPT